MANNLNKYLKAYSNKQKKLAGKLQEIGFIWPGNIQHRYLTCGKPYCACQKDLKARHGPYAYWTSKEGKKTVSRLLKPEEADLLEEWIDNRRKLETIVRQMKELSDKVFKVALKFRKEKQDGRDKGE